MLKYGDNNRSDTPCFDMRTTNRIKNRKGDEKTFFIFIIIALLIAVIIIFFQTDAAGKVRKYIPFFKECADVGGQCFAVSDCSQLTDKPYYTHTANCKAKNEVCCIVDRTSPMYTPPPNDPLCNDKVEGDTCAVRKVCMKDKVEGNLVCEELCVFCANNPKNDKCKVTTANRRGDIISEMNSAFDCQCTGAQCTITTKGYTCITGMCSSTNSGSSNYMCCNKKS